MEWGKSYIEYCEITNQSPDARDQTIFLAGATFNSIENKLPELPELTQELEKTGWLTPEDKDLPLCKHQYIGVGVVLNAIKRLMGTKNLDPEYNKIVNEKFWDLF